MGVGRIVSFELRNRGVLVSGAKQEEKNIIIGTIGFQGLKAKTIQINIFIAEGEKTEGFEGFGLHIPDYQRPYAWEEKQVETLLNDLKDVIESGKKSYLLGSLIFHQNTDSSTLDIVDGQQRLVTLALICAELEQWKQGKDDENWHRKQTQLDDNSFLMGQNFPHSESQKNLKNNFAYIGKWFERNQNEVGKFRELLLGEKNNKIEFVCIVTPNLDDAFIFFDSANSKGKALETYDLIKAYHLSIMNSNDERELIESYARKFEELCKKTKRVHKLFYELLFPARKWIAMEEKFCVPVLISNSYREKCYEEFCIEIPQWLKKESVEHSRDNMGILQQFEGGIDFFDYIEKYNEILSKVETLSLWKNIREIDGNGNRYLRFLFEIAMIVYFDKYGYKNFKKSLIEIAQLVFLIRGIQKPIKRETVAIQATKILPMIYFSSLQCYMRLNCDNIIREMEKKYDSRNLDEHFKNKLGNNNPTIEDFKNFLKKE